MKQGIRAGLGRDCDGVSVPGRRGLFEVRGRPVVHARGQWAEFVERCIGEFLGVVVNALAYYIGDPDSIPNAVKKSKLQHNQWPTSSLDSYYQWREIEVLSLKVFGLQITMQT